MRFKTSAASSVLLGAAFLGAAMKHSFLFVLGALGRAGVFGAYSFEHGV